MSKKLILFADNDPDFLRVRSEFLEMAGYHVVGVNSLEQAKNCMLNEWFHLAIFDVRLVDDDDEHDLSGLMLAKQASFQSIPKIILTKFPDYFHQVLNGISPILEFLSKKDEPDILISAIERIFADRVRINWNLTIDWKARDSFSLVRLIEPKLEGERLLNRAGEFEDLFRRLFRQEDHIRVERLLWHREERAGLLVLAFKQGEAIEPFITVCGPSALMVEETRRFEQFAPKAAGKFGTFLDGRMKAETTHFGANAYTLANNKLEHIQTLVEHYRFGTEKTLSDTLHTLYNEALPAWHQGEPRQEKAKTLDEVYREQLHLSSNVAIGQLESRFQAIEEQLFGVKIVRDTGTVSVHFRGPSFMYTDPLPFLSDLVEISEPTWMVIAPGTLRGETILTDDDGHIWLTDFAEAGPASIFWNFITLEAAIRFDWLEGEGVQHRHDLERALIFSDFARFETSDLEGDVRKAGRTLLPLRKLAAWTVGKNPLAYHRGIFFHAARRLMDYDLGSSLTENEKARLGQLLLSMAMLAHLFKNSPSTKITEILQFPALDLDEESLTVIIGERRVRLQPQPFYVFRYLFQNEGRICNTEELVREALAGNPQYLHTLIGRIRREIEPDARRPRYLITEHNVGYKLLKRPQ